MLGGRRQPAFEDVDGFHHPARRLPPHGADAEAAPFVEDVGEVLLAWHVEAIITRLIDARSRGWCGDSRLANSAMSYRLLG